MFAANLEAPEGFICRDIQAGEMAVPWIKGVEGQEGGEMHIHGSAINSRAMVRHVSIMQPKITIFPSVRQYMPSRTVSSAFQDRWVDMVG